MKSGVKLLLPSFHQKLCTAIGCDLTSESWQHNMIELELLNEHEAAVICACELRP